MADRIAGLRLTRLIGFQGVRGFEPSHDGPDSCHAFRNGCPAVGDTAAGDLLQTQTEMIIQRQNRDLLTSMNSLQGAVTSAADGGAPVDCRHLLRCRACWLSGKTSAA